MEQCFKIVAVQVSMGDNINNFRSNVAGLIVVIIAIGPGAWSILHVFGII